MCKSRNGNTSKLHCVFVYNESTVWKSFSENRKHVRNYIILNHCVESNYIMILVTNKNTLKKKIYQTCIPVVMQTVWCKIYQIF